MAFALTLRFLWLVAVQGTDLTPNKTFRGYVHAYLSSAWALTLIPRLSALSIIGLYSLYLLWLGLPVLMKAPPDRATGYTAAVVIIMFVIMFVVTFVLGMVFVL